jgi:uncharacterized membrane protein YedE/YeeE
MGGALAAICLAGLRFDRWFVNETRKGQWLTKQLGAAKAVWIWRLVLLAGFAFGVCLACRWINPIINL